MPHPLQPSTSRRADIETDRLLLVVVGAHLRAEIEDRAAAYALQERMMEWLDGRFGTEAPHPCAAALVTDVWYLNQSDLQARPTISVGGPELNALSAFLVGKLPSVYTVTGVMAVHMDLDLGELAAVCWGVDRSATAGAVEAFCARYLDAFMSAAVGE